ncbi:sigma-70 family RNA polymerase sigma factor [bacterium]|nr:sigma-70 family RNA polymerase sigma factor [bacterium]
MTANLSALVQRLAGADPADASDADLLGRFVAGRDAAAFAELVRRHGPAVFGVCRRVTGDHHLAEDAFQAVFVVLAAKAGGVRPASALGGWLYGVAHRTALRARTMRDRRRRREQAAARRESVPAESPDDLAAVLDAEIARLPAHLRAAVVLCELGGRSRAEAAAELGVREGTLSSRLAAARKALAARLRTRGLALPAALGPVVLTAVPPDLCARAAAAATDPHLVPAAAAALSQGVLRAMLLQKLKFVPLALGAAAALTAGLFAAQRPAPPAAPAPVALQDAPKAAPKAAPAGPNRLVVWRKGALVSLDPAGQNEKPALSDKYVVHPNMFVVSPDGKRVAVVQVQDKEKKDDELPPPKLYVREIGKDAGTELDEVGDAATAAWSGDGTQLVVCALTDGPTPMDLKTTTTLYTVATKTRTPVKLPDDHILTDWSRDGRFFLTMQVGTDLEAPVAGTWVMNRDGTPHRKLLDGTAVAMARFSPDGKQVLSLVLPAVKEETPKERVERQKLGASRPRPLAVLSMFDVAAAKATPVKDVPLNADIQGLSWAPDGKRIAYVWRERHPPGTDPMTETTTSLTVCDPDGANQRTILSETARGTSGMPLAGVDWR